MKFTQFPVTVDPASNVITLRTDPEDRWTHLHRVEVKLLDFPLMPTNDVAHVFGPYPEQVQCDFFLCYNTDGRLVAVLERISTGWSRHTVAEELAGRVECLPSVRFVFADEEDRGQFMRTLQKMGEAVRRLEMPTPEDSWQLLTLILRQPHAPRLVPVAVETASS